LGIALPQTPASGRIDQRPGLVARRILEGRASRAAPQRLRFLAGAGDITKWAASLPGSLGDARARK
jgi:hypothetical protein